MTEIKLAKLNILSIDFAIRQTGLYYSKNEIFKTTKPHRNFLELKTDFISYLENVDYCIIEDYAYRATTNTIIQIAERIGILKLLLDELSIKYTMLNISIWKSLMKWKYFKSTKKEKELYIETFKNRFGKVADSIDSVDACLIYLAFKKIVTEDGKTTQAVTDIKNNFANQTKGG